MGATLFVIGTAVITGLVFLLISARIIRKFSIGLYIFSPIPIFYFAFLLSFVVRSLAMLFDDFRGGAPIYFFELNNFISAHFWGGVGACIFMFGALFSLERSTRELDRANPVPLSEVSAKQLRALQRVMVWGSLISGIGYLIFLVRSGSFGSDFGMNRSLFVQSLFGNGQYFVVRIICSILLLWAIFLRIWGIRLGLIGIVSTGLFLLSQVVVTARSTVTSILFGVIFIEFLRRVRLGRIPNVAKPLLLIFGLVVLGTWLGLLRDTGSDVTWMQSILFLTATFDMGEMFQITMQRFERMEWGLSWFEDIFITYIPRAFFSDKPTIYGTTRLQVEIGYDTTTLENVFRGTFPVGIYGDGYANFGFIGVIFTLLVAGLIVGWLYGRIIRGSFDPAPRWNTLFCFAIYSLYCADSLGYMRSFGGFLAALVSTLAIAMVLRVILSRFYKAPS